MYKKFIIICVVCCILVGLNLHVEASGERIALEDRKEYKLYMNLGVKAGHMLGPEQITWAHRKIKDSHCPSYIVPGTYLSNLKSNLPEYLDSGLPWIFNGDGFLRGQIEKCKESVEKYSYRKWDNDFVLKEHRHLHIRRPYIVKLEDSELRAFYLGLSEFEGGCLADQTIPFPKSKLSSGPAQTFLPMVSYMQTTVGIQTIIQYYSAPPALSFTMEEYDYAYQSKRSDRCSCEITKLNWEKYTEALVKAVDYTLKKHGFTPPIPKKSTLSWLTEKEPISARPMSPPLTDSEIEHACLLYSSCKHVGDSPKDFSPSLHRK